MKSDKVQKAFEACINQGVDGEEIESELNRLGYKAEYVVTNGDISDDLIKEHVADFSTEAKRDGEKVFEMEDDGNGYWMFAGKSEDQLANALNDMCSGSKVAKRVAATLLKVAAQLVQHKERLNELVGELENLAAKKKLPSGKHFVENWLYRLPGYRVQAEQQHVLKTLLRNKKYLKIIDKFDRVFCLGLKRQIKGFIKK